MTRRLLAHILTFAAGASLTLLALAYLAAEPPAPRLTDLANTAPAGPALTVDHLTAKISPVLQQKLIEAKPDIIAAAGGPVARTAVRLGFPVAVREVPTFTEHGIRAVTDELGHYSISDLMQLLEHAALTRDVAPGSDRLLAELRGRSEASPQRHKEHEGCTK
ncbi:MAG: hypothetical protein P4L84_37265 [Isosphaeraceae bacterium]|nr:hypothetical protein [Isosphaeraceae bacterium]